MTRAKRELLERTRSEAEQALYDMVDRWPCDIVTSIEIDDVMGCDRPRGAALRHALDRAGIVKIRELKSPGGDGIRTRVVFYALRGAAEWRSAPSHKIRQEVGRFTFGEKMATFAGDGEANLAAGWDLV